MNLARTFHCDLNGTTPRLIPLGKHQERRPELRSLACIHHPTASKSFLGQPLQQEQALYVTRDHVLVFARGHKHNKIQLFLRHFFTF